jgi:SAM-dependent methyltransferase
MSPTTEWWQTFFTGVAVECWLRCTTPEQTRQEVDFIQHTLQVPPPARLLDVPCGGGRHCLELAARGYAMTGVDISPEFLAAARAGARERSLPVRWEQLDMRDLSWREEFDGAFSFGNSFGYCDDADNAAFVRGVCAALKPGAQFVLETGYVTEVLFPSLQERFWYQLSDMLMLAQRRYDPADGRLHVEYTWIQEGHTEKRQMSARVYSYRELARVLQEAGFTDVRGCGSLMGEPFRLGASRLLITATKDHP